MDAFISVNNDRHYMSILKKDFGYGGERLKSYYAQPLRLGGMVAGRISLPEREAPRDWEKQGKTGLACPSRHVSGRPGMPVRRVKHQTQFYASAASRQISRYRRRLFPTKFALL